MKAKNQKTQNWVKWQHGRKTTTSSVFAEEMAGLKAPDKQDYQKQMIINSKN